MADVIARWESRGGKDWVELYETNYDFRFRSNGHRGYAGKTYEDAMAYMRPRVAKDAYLFCSQKSAMKRVV